MQDNNSTPKIPVNYSPVEVHHRQMFWQVWMPIIVSSLLVLALGTLAIIGAIQGSPVVEHWGAIAAILVILPVLLAGVIILAVVGGIVYGLALLLKNMPNWMLRLQLLMIRVALAFRRAADTATQPVFKVNTFTARAATLWDRIFHGQWVR